MREGFTRESLSRAAGARRPCGGARGIVEVGAGLVLVASLALLPRSAAAGAIDSLPPFMQARLDAYVLGRAFPDSTIPDSVRRLGRNALGRIHVADGLPFFRPWSPDSAVLADTLAPIPHACVWHSIGPTNVNGRVTGITFDPDDAQRVFASTVGGIWRSVDGGRAWHRVSDNHATSATSPPARWACVAAAGGGSAAVYAGGGDPSYAVSPFGLPPDSTYGEGIWRSLSNGNPGSWTKVTKTELDAATIFRLRVDPTRPDHVYAATSLGVYEGTPLGSGMSWTPVGGVSDHHTIDFLQRCSDLAVDFEPKGDILYAGVYGGGAGAGIWKHVGDRWTPCNSGLVPLSTSSGSIGGVALAIDPKQPRVLYAKIADADDNGLYGIFKTTTAAEPPAGSTTAWSAIPTGTSDGVGETKDFCWYNNAVEVDPQDGQVVVFGALQCLVSLDGGATIHAHSISPDPSFATIHDDVHALAFDPRGGHSLWCGNDGGLDRSTDLHQTRAASTGTGTVADWHWEHASHGMSTAEMFVIASQTADLPAVTLGAQDNGNSVTFGNRAWYHIANNDATGAAIDAVNPLWCYTSDNGDLSASTDPVTGTATGSPSANFGPDEFEMTPPVAADPVAPFAAVAAGRVVDEDNNILRRGVFQSAGALSTSNVLSWQEISSGLTTNQWITSVAIAPTSGFTHVLAGFRNTATGSARIGRFKTSATPPWHMASAGLPALSPNGVTFAATDDSHAFAAFGGLGGGKVAVSTDGGDTWTQATDHDATGTVLQLPALTCVAAHPTDTNVIYVGTVAGVIKGTVAWGTPPVITWVSYDQGMPADVDVTGLSVNGKLGTIVAATMGFGAFERPLSDALCADPMLIVRDNVFDRGTDPSPTDLADPEHPIETPPGSHQFVAASDKADRVYWCSSTDIRIDDPTDGAVPPGNVVPPPGVAAVASAPLAPDHVEIETCAVDHGECPPGSMVDVSPFPGHRMRVHVQVANRGTRPASHVRVMVLWADAGIGLGPLPADFWTTDFPPSGDCPPYTDPGPWQPVDPKEPSRTIEVVDPDQPGVATFNWDVPKSVSDHCCMIAIVDSPDDPLEDWIRTTDERNTDVLVPRSRHIAQRNLHPVRVIGGKMVVSESYWLWLQNGRPWKRNLTLWLSRAHLPACMSVSVQMPNVRWDEASVLGARRIGAIPPHSKQGPSGPRPASRRTRARAATSPLHRSHSSTRLASAAGSSIARATGRPAKSKAPSLGSTSWAMVGRVMTIPGIALQPGQSIRVGITCSTKCRDIGRSARLSVIATHDSLGDTTMVGGNTFVLREPLPKARGSGAVPSKTRGH